jgi:hypothetical protein
MVRHEVCGSKRYEMGRKNELGSEDEEVREKRAGRERREESEGS